MALGIVKWFNTKKGYGFITPDEGGRDVFVHVSEVEKAGLASLDENHRIEFELFQRGDGRTSASGLRYLEDEPEDNQETGDDQKPDDEEIDDEQEA